MISNIIKFLKGIFSYTWQVKSTSCTGKSHIFKKEGNYFKSLCGWSECLEKDLIVDQAAPRCKHCQKIVEDNGGLNG